MAIIIPSTRNGKSSEDGREAAESQDAGLFQARDQEGFRRRGVGECVLRRGVGECVH